MIENFVFNVKVWSSDEDFSDNDIRAAHSALEVLFWRVWDPGNSYTAKQEMSLMDAAMDFCKNITVDGSPEKLSMVLTAPGRFENVTIDGTGEQLHAGGLFRDRLMGLSSAYDTAVGVQFADTVYAFDDGRINIGNGVEAVCKEDDDVIHVLLEVNKKPFLAADVEKVLETYPDDFSRDGTYLHCIYDAVNAATENDKRLQDMKFNDGVLDISGWDALPSMDMWTTMSRERLEQKVDAEIVAFGEGSYDGVRSVMVRPETGQMTELPPGLLSGCRHLASVLFLPGQYSDISDVKYVKDIYFNTPVQFRVLPDGAPGSKTTVHLIDEKSDVTLNLKNCFNSGKSGVWVDAASPESVNLVQDFGRDGADVPRAPGYERESSQNVSRKSTPEMSSDAPEKDRKFE